jgi:hypothetical protein
MDATIWELKLTSFQKGVCVTQPVDVGFNALLKKHVKDQFRSWQIEEYCNNHNNKLPSPDIPNIVEWVNFAYDKISEETIRKTFCLIGFVVPNNNDDADNENSLN